MPVILRSALALLVAVCAVAGEERVTNRSSITIGVGLRDIKAAASVSWWVTEDRGASWRRAHVVELKPDATQPPSFPFSPPHDGVYGFQTAVRWRDGTEEAPPQPGRQLGADTLIAVDTTPPAFPRFVVEVGAQDAGVVRCQVVWQVEDAHLDPEPARLELNAGGEVWTSLADRLAAQGALHLTLPPGSRLRLWCADRAGNAATSTPWQAPGRLPALPDPKPAKAGGEQAPALPDLKSPDLTGVAKAPVTESVTPATTVGAVPKPAPAEAPLPELSEPWTLAQEPLPRPGDLEPPAVEILLSDNGSLAPAVLLAGARRAAAANECDTAVILYRRLRDTAEADSAAVELVALLQRAGRLERALTEAQAVPPECEHPRLAIATARVLLQLGRLREAETTLARVPANGEQVREALLLNAVALAQQKRWAEARAILRHLAQGTDACGLAARGWLERETRPEAPARLPAPGRSNP